MATKKITAQDAARISVLGLPPLSWHSLLTGLLLLTIAFVDVWLTPTLHVGVFLYPVSILMALWWGAMGLPTKKDQERALHAINELESRLLDLEERLEDQQR